MNPAAQHPDQIRTHTYHGTTRNRCAAPCFPRSRPTVRAEVIGSPSTRLCAHFRSCCSSQRRAIPDQRSPNSAPCPLLDRSLAIRSVDGVSRGSNRGRRATTSRRRRPPGGSPRRQPQPASRGSRALATPRRRSAVPVAAGAEPDTPGQGTSRPETASPRTSTAPRAQPAVRADRPHHRDRSGRGDASSAWLSFVANTCRYDGQALYASPPPGPYPMPTIAALSRHN
jgi:hypothetical protein